MKQYYTLAQSFSLGDNRNLGEYLKSQNIRYTLGADFVDELQGYGYGYKSIITHNQIDRSLVRIYRVLIDEYELTAIQMAVGGVSILRNRTGLEIKNKIRKMFSWIIR